MVLAAPALAADRIEMEITRNDEFIGTHSIDFVREGGRLHVDTKVEVAVKMAFVTVYRMLKTSRETWEGDRVVAYDATIDDNGMAFDYNIVKERLKALCDHMDEKVLLPERSPHLTLSDDDGYLVATFGNERLPFLHRDVRTLPVRNITVEELAPWFLASLQSDEAIVRLDAASLEVQVSPGPGQWASAAGTPAG